MSKTASAELVAAFQPTAKQFDRFRTEMMLRDVRAKPEVLVVDTDPHARQLLNDMLKTFYKPHMAGSAKEGWSHFLNIAPDIVFLGTRLPDLHESKLAKLIKTVDAMSYLVLIAESTEPKDIPQVKESNVRGMLTKPYDNEKILDVAEKYLHSRKPKK
jgi:DNA-binding NtrC family response regulator